MYGLQGEKIWIDDERLAPEGYRWCKNYNQAIAIIDYFSKCENGIDIICFDHDLGEEKSGYDIARYIAEHQIPIESYEVHTANPAGRKNIIQLLNHYGYKRVDRYGNIIKD